MPIPGLDYAPLVTRIIPTIRFLQAGGLIAAAPGGTGWPTNNKALYVRFKLEPDEVPVSIDKMFHINGASAVTGTFDMGIYDAAGTRLGSVGSTSQAGSTSTLQIYSLSSVVALTIPGFYYAAMSASTVSATYFRNGLGAARFGQAMGILEQTTAHPLPATATFAALTTTFLPFIGMIPIGAI